MNRAKGFTQSWNLASMRNARAEVLHYGQAGALRRENCFLTMQFSLELTLWWVVRGGRRRKVESWRWGLKMAKILRTPSVRLV